MGKLDYQLLDFGSGRKLERFGEVVVDRPEVLAVDAPRLKPSEWRRKANAVFTSTGSQSGKWHWHTPPPLSWEIVYAHSVRRISALLKPGKFKHVGIFPEQEKHWDWLAGHITPGMRVLNLFAYTGMASLVAAVSGGDVFHVDSSGSAVKAAGENAKHNGLSNIHWVVDDALTFSQKEVRRGRTYDVVIMDPPVFGKDKKGGNHRLVDRISPLVETAARLLVSGGVLLLNTYSPKITLKEMVNTCEKKGLKHNDSGGLSVNDPHGRNLVLSRYVKAVK